MTIPACTTPPINWVRCRDVRFSHLLLRKTKERWGAVDTSASGSSINEETPLRSGILPPAALGATTFSADNFYNFLKQPTECRCPTDQSDRMDTLCVITHQHRSTRTTRGASARRRRSLPVGNLSLSMLCSPSRRTQAAAGRLFHQQLRFCLSPDTSAYR